MIHTTLKSEKIASASNNKVLYRITFSDDSIKHVASGTHDIESLLKSLPYNMAFVTGISNLGTVIILEDKK